MEPPKPETALPVRKPNGNAQDESHYTLDVLARAMRHARSLLRVGDVAEVEARVLGCFAEGPGAAWTALYRPSGPQYVLRGMLGTVEHDLPPTLSPDLIQALLDEGRGVAPCGASTAGLLPDKAVFVPLPSEGHLPPAAVFFGPGAAGASAATMQLLPLLAELCSEALQNSDLVEELRAQVFVDAVSGCYNRRAFDEHLTVELVRARRYERPLCLLLLDLDGFKHVNDELGHQVGDYAIQKVGEVLRSSFRTTDRVCRYGGDEFAVIFPETQKEDVIRLAERLRKQIIALFPDDVVPLEMTTSIGVAGFPRDAVKPEDLIRVADLALYRAKTSGRNQVISA